jgi:ribose transport system permease protein
MNIQKIVTKIKRFEQLQLLLILLMICVIITIFAPVFISSTNIINLLRQTSQVGICSLGLCMIALIGEIDLSISAVQAAVGILSVFLINTTGSVTLGIVAGLALGVLIGLINAVIVIKGGVVSLVATLATQTIIRGVIMIVTNAASIPCNSSTFKTIGVGYIGYIPVPVVIWLVCIVAVFFLLKKTVFGRYIYVIGGNMTAASLCGINVKKYKYIVFMLSGFLTALAALILTGRMNSGQPSAGTGFEMQVISAVVLGGVSLSGGRGNVTGVLIGAFILSVLSNGLVLMDISSFYQDVIRGIILIFAVYMDNRKSKSFNKKLSLARTESLS